MHFRLYYILGIYRVIKIMIEIIHIGILKKFHFLPESVAYVIVAFQSWYGTYVKYYNDQRFGWNE